MKSFTIKNLTFIALVLFIGISAINTADASRNISLTPKFGVLMPMGDMGDTWENGVQFGLNFYNETDQDLDFGLGIRYSNWGVNTSNLMALGGRTYKIEREEGSNSAYALLGLAKYCFMSDQKLWAEAGLGLVYFDVQDIEIVGFYPYGGSAINRNVYIAGEEGYTGMFSLGIGYRVVKNIQLKCAFQQTFNEHGGSNVLVSLGFLPFR